MLTDTVDIQAPEMGKTKPGGDTSPTVQSASIAQRVEAEQAKTKLVEIRNERFDERFGETAAPTEPQTRPSATNGALPVFAAMGGAQVRVMAMADQCAWPKRQEKASATWARLKLV